MSFSTVFSVFPGRVAVTPTEAAGAVFGWCAKTVRNRLYAGTFPLPLTRVGNKQVVRLVDLAAALGEDVSDLPGPAPAVVVPVSRGRGRPRKAVAGEVQP